MPRLIDRSPFPDDESEVVVRGERVLIRADQMILWVSLTIERVKVPNPLAVPFPVILDTGYNHTFAIHERQLVEWAGFRPDALGYRSDARDRGRRVTLRPANLWVHPNEPGERDRLADRPPHLVSAKRGIAVYPVHPVDEFPRLPLLGLRAIAENRLILDVNGPRREATLRTPARWWPFG